MESPRTRRTRAVPRGAVPHSAASRSAASPGAARLAPLDNLKTVVVAGIIFGHGLLGYTDLFSWTYQAYREANLSEVTKIVGLVLLGPFALFMISLLFLVSGLLTPGSVRRRGRGPYVRSRLVRLGIPFAVYAFVLWPLIVHGLNVWLLHDTASYWQDFMRQVPLLDTGPLWFLLVLLIFSTAYALWSPRRPPRRVDGATVAWLVVAVAGLTFLTRLVFALDTPQFAGLHLWQWPECVGLFTLGVLASGQGWARQVPARILRGCAWAVLAGIVVTALFVFGANPLGVTDTQLTGGLSWPAALVAADEGTLTVCGSVWLLGVAQRRLTGTGPTWRRAGRGAYAAFLLQGPVLLGLAVALRPLPLVAEVKALTVSVGGVLACFTLGWLLVTRTRLGRFL